MRTIWRFDFAVTDEPVLTGVPEGAEFLPHVHVVDAGWLAVWAKVDSDAPKGVRRLQVRGAGHPHFESVGRYLGTAVVSIGSSAPPLVWHVFEEPTP